MINLWNIFKYFLNVYVLRMSTYFGHVAILSGCIPHLPQRSLAKARGQSTVDELDRRLRPDRSILPLIDSARNDASTSTSFAVLPSTEGHRPRVRDYFGGGGDLLESISRARPTHAKLPVRLSTPYKHPRAHPSRAFRGSTLHGHEIILPPRGRKPKCLRDVKKLMLLLLLSLFFFFLFLFINKECITSFNFVFFF